MEVSLENRRSVADAGEGVGPSVPFGEGSNEGGATSHGGGGGGTSLFPEKASSVPRVAVMDVDGMTCAICVGIVENLLNR